MANGLGRGLSSLIPQKTQKTGYVGKNEPVVDVTSPADQSRVLDIPVEGIARNPLQPRRRFPDAAMSELTESIRIYGIIQPLIVTKARTGYELIAGERRLRAAQALRMKTVPAIVREADEQRKLELALVENIQREDLNPIELAMAYRKLLDEFNLTQEELARRVGKSRPVVTNTLRLLNLPSDIQRALIENEISESHAKILVGLDSEEKQAALLRKIMDKNLTFQKTLMEARRMGGTKEARIKINYADKDKEFALREFFGTRAEIKRLGKGGQIIIYYYSDEELREIVEKVRSKK